MQNNLQILKNLKAVFIDIFHISYYDFSSCHSYILQLRIIPHPLSHQPDSQRNQSLLYADASFDPHRLSQQKTL